MKDIALCDIAHLVKTGYTGTITCYVGNKRRSVSKDNLKDLAYKKVVKISGSNNGNAIIHLEED